MSPISPGNDDFEGIGIDTRRVIIKSSGIGRERGWGKINHQHYDAGVQNGSPLRESLTIHRTA